MKKAENEGVIWSEQEMKVFVVMVDVVVRSLYGKSRTL